MRAEWPFERFDTAVNNDLKLKQLGEAIDAARQSVERAASLASGLQDGSVGKGAAETLFRERRRRDECFPAGLFREPAWDILLALFIARDQGRGLRQADLLRRSIVPATTGLRMLDQLEEAGLIRRAVADRSTKRRVVSLTEEAISRMDEFTSGR